MIYRICGERVSTGSFTDIAITGGPTYEGNTTSDGSTEKTTGDGVGKGSAAETGSRRRLHGSVGAVGTVIVCQLLEYSIHRLKGKRCVPVSGDGDVSLSGSE